MTDRRYFTITELTAEFGITTRTLRFYEDEKLINPRRHGRKRLYTPRDRTRVKLILRGKRLGFSLAEIREIIEMYDHAPGENRQLQILMQRINERKAELEQKRRDIEETLKELAEVESLALLRINELEKLQK
ncbi:MerR family transcriptional regulator [Kiloniella laminariae]|uniref:MerR family transcriptional regulator n=1 Tax=Kiloniella laminariae TaxID=454162 RepID=UPI00038072D0|nr:MerR family DNA-binding transcriptional regulator [Kiloniella laminariae]